MSRVIVGEGIDRVAIIEMLITAGCQPAVFDNTMLNPVYIRQSAKPNRKSKIGRNYRNRSKYSPRIDTPKSERKNKAAESAKGE